MERFSPGVTLATYPLSARPSFVLPPMTLSRLRWLLLRHTCLRRSYPALRGEGVVDGDAYLSVRLSWWYNLRFLVSCVLVFYYFILSWLRWTTLIRKTFRFVSDTYIKDMPGSAYTRQQVGKLFRTLAVKRCVIYGSDCHTRQPTSSYICCHPSTDYRVCGIAHTLVVIATPCCCGQGHMV